MVMAHSIFCIVSLSSYRLPDHLAWLICTPCKNYEGIRSCDPYYVERWKLLFLSICFKLRNHHAAAAKSLQSCLTLCDPRDSNPPGFPVPCLGLSRQEHWSGLPFTSLMHEGEKWKWSHSVMSDPQWPHGLQPTRLLCPWGFPGKSTGVGCHCLLRRNHHACLLSSNNWNSTDRLQAFLNSLRFNLELKSLVLLLCDQGSKLPGILEDTIILQSHNRKGGWFDW